MLVGRLGEDALAAGAIGITYFNLMFYFLIGVSSALDTLGSQAYGADDKAGVISWCAASARPWTCVANARLLDVWTV
jgi:MATE family multidrug resistance protein